MKNLIICFICTLSLSVSLFSQEQSKWIRVNQLGYLPSDVKVAVFISTSINQIDSFKVYDALSDDMVFQGAAKVANASKWGMRSAYRLDFSKYSCSGGYYIKCGGIKSPLFRIDANVYKGVADYLLTYMRQQRCGYNPYNDTLCHQHDGYIVDHPTRSGEKIDVRGGWHDATDYLQYQTTSATAVYHLLFAYMEQENKSVFKDEYDANGKKGGNGIPDILDEAKWGLDWLVKMNPEDKVMFAQIADDRDHAGFRLPYRDKVDYGWGSGTGRPVYFVTGKPQGLGKWINRTTGVASVAGKFASSFALGSVVFKNIDPKFSNKIKVKAEQAYRFAEENPGNTQTACLVSPYFYEEDTYTDDIELAASTIFNYSGGEAMWGKRADYWGELEPVSPWMELGRGRHYQFYPFINLGHYYLANSKNSAIASKYKDFMKQGLQDLKNRAADDPFMNGIPYIWCSNNLLSSAITQARLYNKVTSDSTYIEMEAALRDWLFGCNPWGSSMICGFPATAEKPDSPHSSYFVINGDNTYGGLVDGPVYKTVFEERAGKSLTKPDAYAQFNQGIAVYHDDRGDYSSNEPTMDGTAGLTYYFAAKENEGDKLESDMKFVKDDDGAIIRINPDKKVIYLVFTADSMFNGGEKILKTLSKAKIKGSFFFTGNALRLPEHKSIINKIIEDGHYVGGHSDGHLLYAPWGKGKDSTLFTVSEIMEDISKNMAELKRFGLNPDKCRWFLPPYEHYNKFVVDVLTNMGLKVVNYTPGIATPADYTVPSMPNYQPTQKLIDKLYAFEKRESMNGALLLIHPGVLDERTDKLFNRLGEIIEYFKSKGYSFQSLN